MNTWMRFLTAAALCLCGLSAHCRAQASQVTLDFSGQSIASGSNILVTATTPIAHSEIYYYAISGTCHGVGSSLVTLFVPPGTTFEKALSLLSPSTPLTPYLQGYVLDPGGKFPFNCVNKLGKGSVPITGVGTFHGHARLKAGIERDGIVRGLVRDVNFGLGARTDKTDSIFVDEGQVVVETVPPTSGTQPDLSYIGSTGALQGVGVYNPTGIGQTATVTGLKRGKTASLEVVLQNAGSVPDIYTLTANDPGPGFGQKFIYKGLDITPQVTDSNGFTVPKEALAPGEVRTLTWKISNKSATSGSTEQLLNAVSAASGAEDTIGFTVSGTGN